MSDTENQVNITPWGFWATIGLTVVVLLITAIAQILVIAVLVLLSHSSGFAIEMDTIESNGFILAVATVLTAPITIGATCLFAKLRTGITLKEYFNFYKTSKIQYIKWLLAIGLMIICSDALSVFLGHPVVPDVMLDMYRTAYIEPLFFFAIIIMAPLNEELLFRGLLFKGLANSKVGTTGAILISSLCWAIIHTQYDLYGISSIFVAGLLLGFARHKTQSIYLPIVLHMAMNIIASIQLLIYV